MNITIPTDSLRKLLADHPEVELRLSSMACEKVAEEIKRKVGEKLSKNECAGSRATSSSRPSTTSGARYDL